ncbi:MAG: hypothetical protein IKL42_03310 [Clostridia bacterium]|nr:hypothetical protein [Clostridia bacterium]
MMVFLAVVLVLIAVVALVLWQKVRISYELKLENFKITFTSKITVFGKTLFDSANKKPKGKAEKTVEESQTEKPQKRKVTLADITTFKDAADPVVKTVFKLVKNGIGLDSFETDVRVALSDPMDNGIAYGIVCGVINNIYAVIMKRHPRKEYFLDIAHDFKSGEGLILENKGTLYVRPGKVAGLVAAAWLGDKKLRKAISDIKKLFTKEENVK